MFQKTRSIEAEQFFLRAQKLAPSDFEVYQHFGETLFYYTRNFIWSMISVTVIVGFIHLSLNSLRKAKERFCLHSMQLKTSNKFITLEKYSVVPLASCAFLAPSKNLPSFL